MRTTRNKRILALLTSVLLCLSVVATGLAATISVFASATALEVGDLVKLTVNYNLSGGTGTPGSDSVDAKVSNLDPSKIKTTADDWSVRTDYGLTPPVAGQTLAGWTLTPGGTTADFVGLQSAGFEFVTPVIRNDNYNGTTELHTAEINLHAVWRAAGGGGTELRTVKFEDGADANGTTAPKATHIAGTLPGMQTNVPVGTPLAQIAGYTTTPLADSTGTFTHTGWTASPSVDSTGIQVNTVLTAKWEKKGGQTPPAGTVPVTFSIGNGDGITAPSKNDVVEFPGFKAPKNADGDYTATLGLDSTKLDVDTTKAFTENAEYYAPKSTSFKFKGWVDKDGKAVADTATFAVATTLTATWESTGGDDGVDSNIPADSYTFNYDLRTLKHNLPTGTSVANINVSKLYLSKQLSEVALKTALVEELNKNNRVRTSTGRVHTVTSVELADAVAGSNIRTITKLTFADLPTLDVNNSWLVSFQSREGRFPNGATQINFRVAKGDTITEAIAPTWAGYKFLYWADPNEGTGSATLPNAFPNDVKKIERDTVFIPVWQAVDNTPGTAAINVRFHANGGRIVDKDGDVHTALTGPMIINMPKDTKLNNEDLKALIGTVYPPANIVDGSQFVGWSKTATNQTLVPADYVLNTNDENLYAMFKQPITVTLHATPGSVFNEAGTSVASRTEKLPYGSTTLEILNKFYPNIVAPLGKVVAGLSFSSNGSQLAFDQRHNGNTTVWAVYADAIAVAFDANGGTLNNHAGYNEMILRDIPEGMSLGNLKLLMGDNFPTVTPPTGKTFLGWSISQNYANAGSVVDNSFVLTRTTTRLFASYKDAVTVTFDAAPGRFLPGVIAPTSATSHVLTTAKGTALNTVELPAVEAPTGKGLRGWATSRENADKGITVPVNTTLDATQTLYAVYGEPFLTVIFDATAGGTFEGGAKIHTNNRVDKNTLLKDVSVPKVTANKEGYRLAGWATSPANAENGVLLAKDFKITEGMTLFAAFEEGEDEDNSSSDGKSSGGNKTSSDGNKTSSGGSGSVGVSDSSSSKGGVGPKTGDNSMMMIGMIALILAGSGIAAGVVVYKKRKEQE